MPEPALEAPARAEEPGRAVERLRGGLDLDRAGPREEREQPGLVVPHAAEPAAGGEQGGRVVGAQRRDRRRLAARGLVAAAEEGRAREVDGHGRVVARDAHRDGEVGVGRVLRGARPAAREQLVRDGVLGAQGRELGVPQLGVGSVRVDREGGPGREVSRPVDRAHPGVEGVGVRGVDACEREHHARGEARPEAGAVGAVQPALEGDLALEGPDLGDAEGGELCRQQALEALGARRKEVHRDTFRPSLEKIVPPMIRRAPGADAARAGGHNNNVPRAATATWPPSRAITSTM